MINHRQHNYNRTFKRLTKHHRQHNYNRTFKRLTTDNTIITEHLKD